MRYQLVAKPGARQLGPKVTLQCCISFYADASSVSKLWACHNVLDLCRVEDEARASRRRVEDHQKHQRKTKVAIRAAEKAAPELADGEGLAAEEPAGAEPLMSEQWAAEEPDADDDDEPVHHRVFFPNPVKGTYPHAQGYCRPSLPMQVPAPCADQAWVAHCRMMWSLS